MLKLLENFKIVYNNLILFNINKRMSLINGRGRQATTISIDKRLQRLENIPTHPVYPVFSQYPQYATNTLTLFNDSVSTSANFYTIGDNIPTPTNTLDLTFPEVYEKLSFASTSTQDSATGTGTFIIFVEGLDDNYENLTELVFLNGTTPVLTSNNFWRVNRILSVLAGSGATGQRKVNQGVIYCSSEAQTYTTGEPTSLVYHTIGIGAGYSRCGIFTNRKPLTAFNVNFSSNATASKQVEVRIESTRGATNIAADLSIENGLVSYFSEGVGIFLAQTDIRLTAQAQQSGIRFFGSLNTTQYDADATPN